MARTTPDSLEESMTILPYYSGTNHVPKHYTVNSDVQYSYYNLDKFMKSRSLANIALTSLLTYLPDGVFIAGGFVASIINDNHQASDIDLFFNGSDAFEKTYDLFVNPPQHEDAWIFRGCELSIQQKELNKQSERLKLVNVKPINPKRLPIQLIKMVWYETARDVIDSFDFTATQFAINKDELCFNPLSMDDLNKKRLVVHRHQYPLEMLYRLVKYVKKGYSVPAETISSVVKGIRDAESDSHEFLYD